MSTLTAADVARHNSKKSLYLIVHEKVYDVTKFIDEHPGGEEVLLDEGGKDATEAFEDVGHSDDARELLKGLFVADLKRDPSEVKKPAPKVAAPKKATPPSEAQGNALRIVIPVAILGAWLAYRFFA